MSDLRAAAQQALEALELGHDIAKAEADRYHVAMAGFRPERHTQMDAEVQQIAAAITALRAALAQEQPNPPGCDHCNHPLYAATRCRVCGRVTEPKAQEPTPPPEARTEAEKTAYAAGWWDALRKAQQAEPVQELPQRKPLTEEENPSFG